jgi:hypothetical protein
MVHAPYVWNKESYYLVGPQDNKIHYSQYWMRQLLEETHREIIFSWTDKIKELKLNQVEYFLLLAVATFRPGESRDMLRKLSFCLILSFSRNDDRKKQESSFLPARTLP